ADGDVSSIRARCGGTFVSTGSAPVVCRNDAFFRKKKVPKSGGWVLVTHGRSPGGAICARAALFSPFGSRKADATRVVMTAGERLLKRGKNLEGAMAARFNPTKGRVMPPDGKNLLRRRQVKAVREGTMRPYLRTRSNGAQFAHHPADAF